MILEILKYFGFGCAIGAGMWLFGRAIDVTRRALK